MPGAFNGLVGRLVAEAGFDACYVSGAAVSASQGLPDIGVVTLQEFCKVIKDVTTASNLPCLADADTGFGEIEMVRRTVFEYASSGAAGLHIEDQLFPKRCGHLDGKSLVSPDDMATKVSRASDARESFAAAKGMVICARTDARGVEGFSAAIERAKKYVSAGADMIFPEGLESEDEFVEFAAAMKKLKGEAPDGGPFLLANMTEFGKTPHYPLQKFSKMGYHCVIYPVSTLRVAMKPVQELLATIKETGSAESYLNRMFTREELYKSLHYTPGKEWVYPSASGGFKP